MAVRDPKEAILTFREAYGDRFGTADPAVPSDVGQLLRLAKARLDALALLLGIDPELLQGALDHLVYRTDLSESALEGARGLLRIPKRKTVQELLEGMDEGSLRRLRESQPPEEPLSEEAQAFLRELRRWKPK